MKDDIQKYEEFMNKYPDQQSAQDAGAAFIAAVEKLRDEYGVANVVVACVLPFGEANAQGAKHASTHARGWGSSDMNAEIAAHLYGVMTLPVLLRAEQLTAIASGRTKSPFGPSPHQGPTQVPAVPQSNGVAPTEEAIPAAVGQA